MRRTISRSDILIVRNDRLGDTILSLPTVSVLRQRFPDKKIHFLSAPFIEPLINCIEGIDSVVSAPDDDCSIAIEQLRQLPIQRAYCLRPTISNAWTLLRAGIPERIGTSRRFYSPLFTHRVNQSRRDSDKHEADLNLDLLESVGVSGDPQFPPVKIPAEVFDNVDRLLPLDNNSDRLKIIIHPGSGGSAKEWSVKYFKTVADTLKNKLKADVIVTGSLTEQDKCSLVADGNHIDLSGKTDLLELAALLKKADLFIANSTGPLHLAEMLGSKVIGIYPPIKECLPSRWGPYNHPDQAVMPDLPICNSCHPGSFSTCKCLEQLLPEAVIDKALSLLSNS